MVKLKITKHGKLVQTIVTQEKVPILQDHQLSKKNW